MRSVVIIRSFQDAYSDAAWELLPLFCAVLNFPSVENRKKPKDEPFAKLFSIS
jgi:hypothetical protein